MASRNLRERDVEETDIELNMTPMIDIVFQMILFFIIITDFSKQEIALLELPYSTVGIDDEGEEEDRVIINITAPHPQTDAELEGMKGEKRRNLNKILVRGRAYKFEDLAGYLRLRGVNFKPEPENPTLSRTSVLVRCDGEQAFDYVKAILQICAQQEVAIYRIEIATAEKEVQ